MRWNSCAKNMEQERNKKISNPKYLSVEKLLEPFRPLVLRSKFMQIEQMEGKIIELGPGFNYEKSIPEIQNNQVEKWSSSNEHFEPQNSPPITISDLKCKPILLKPRDAISLKSESKAYSYL